jgi:hypothetical protein
LIEPGWIELQLMSRMADRLATVRAWPHQSDLGSPEKLYRRQAVDDVFQEVSFNPNDGRISLPPAVLAFLSVHPQPPESKTKAKEMYDGQKSEGKRTALRYGGQQVFVQASENSITILSLVRRLVRSANVRDELPFDG